jgi:hypothetical protein
MPRCRTHNFNCYTLHQIDLPQCWTRFQQTPTTSTLCLLTPQLANGQSGFCHIADNNSWKLHMLYQHGSTALKHCTLQVPSCSSPLLNPEELRTSCVLVMVLQTMWLTVCLCLSLLTSCNTSWSDAVFCTNSVLVPFSDTDLCFLCYNIFKIINSLFHFGISS